MEELAGVEVTPESKAGQGPKDATKSKSPVKKSRDVVTTSATTEGETGSGCKGKLDIHVFLERDKIRDFRVLFP
jgi:hypothetical protein